MIQKGNKEVAIQTQIQPPCVFPCKWARSGLLFFHLLMQLPRQQLEPGHAGGLLDYWSQFYQANRKITVSKLSQFEKDMNCSVSKYWYYAKSPLLHRHPLQSESEALILNHNQWLSIPLNSTLTGAYWKGLWNGSVYRKRTEHFFLL